MKLRKQLLALKESPLESEVDHISILHDLQEKYSNGCKELEPLMIYFFNEIEYVPTLKEKDIWNDSSFSEKRKVFIDSFQELGKAVDLVLESLN